MDNDKQRIAFLQYLGWTELNRDSKLGNYRALRGTSPEGKKNQIAPNPLKDLNIIHNAEKVLPDLYLYRRFLYLVVLEDPTNISNEPAFSTPTQRLEAFLKTVNRWKE